MSDFFNAKRWSLIVATDPPPHQQGMVVTLEGTNLVLAIVISSLALLVMFARIVSKFNAVTAEIRDLREDLNSHSNVEGHAKLLEQVKIIQKEFSALDKKFDIHLQDYTNYKDANLLDRNGLRERIDHKWERTEDEFKEVKVSIKDLQGFLQKRDNFKIRE